MVIQSRKVSGNLSSLLFFSLCNISVRKSEILDYKEEKDVPAEHVGVWMLLDAVVMCEIS